MIHTPDLLLLTTALAASAGALVPVAVPSGTPVWLQEVLTDRVVGVGLVARFRFVMPALADQVPPAELYMQDAYEAEPLSDEDMAALNDGSLTGIPADGDGPVFEVLPPDTPALDLGEEMPADDVAGIIAEGGDMIPEEAFDLPIEPMPGLDGSDDGDMPVPAAPDVLMQDPNHADVVWLCENVALPRIGEFPERPRQVVISLSSAESEFGTFDPRIVQLFEGFRIPADRDACLWEPW